MAAQGKVLYNYNGEYKKGILGKKKVSANLYEDYIEGTGVKYYVGDLKEVPFKLNISDIKKVEIKEINDNKCIQIEYISDEPDDKDKGTSKLLLPNVAKIDEAKKVLYDMVDKLFQEATQKAIMDRMKREKSKKFYEEKKASYGLNESNTYHSLKDRDMQYVGFNVEKSAVAVIAIDGENQQDGKFSIAYDKVRYFGKLEKIDEKFDAISQLEFDGVSIDISGMGSIVLTYKNVNGKYVALRLPGSVYDELEKAIPKKEYSLVIAEEKAEAERLEAERIAREKAEAERLEAERLAKQKEEEERIAREKAEAERLEAERIAKEKAEAERLEAERLAKIKEEEERIAREKAEAERLEAERLAAEQAEKDRLEAERLAKIKEEEERKAREKEEAERLEAERLAAEQAEKDRLEAERLAKIKEEERLAKEKAEAEKAEAERKAKEKAEAEKAEAEKAEAERKAKEEAEKAEAERLAKEKAEAEKATAPKNESGDDMLAFEKRIKKLMIMKNTGILTDAEFEAEKQKLFDLL